jgi:hypothetical protein
MKTREPQSNKSFFEVSVVLACGSLELPSAAGFLMRKRSERKDAAGSRSRFAGVDFDSLAGWAGISFDAPSVVASRSGNLVTFLLGEGIGGVTLLRDVRDVNSPCGLGLGVSVASVVFAESATNGGTAGVFASHSSAPYAEEWGTRFLCVT